MESNRNALIVRGMQGLRMEISDHRYVRANAAWWKGRQVCSPYSRLYLIAGGDGWISQNDKQVRLQSEYAYFIPAGLTFDYGCDTMIEKLYFHIHLIKPDGYDLVQNAAHIAACPMEAGWLAHTMAIYQSSRWMDAVALQRCLYDVLVPLLEQYPAQNQPIPLYSNLTEQAMQYVQQHLSAHLPVHDMAAALFVSESTLTRTFRHETGRTIRQYAEDMLMTTAQKLLSETDRSLGDISEALGFRDRFYFSRRFRQRFNEPPSEYRKRLKQVESSLLLNESSM